MGSSNGSTLNVLDEPVTLGLSLLVAPEHPSIDIVFIHGFNGHPERTWRHKGDVGNHPDVPEDHGDERPRKFQKILGSVKIPRDRKPVYWPKDLLPHTVPHARILAYGYDTRLGHRLSSPRSQKSVYDFAKDFLLELEAIRRCQPTRPLLFIAHSLGGVVVKEMLRQSYGYLNHQPHLRTISESTLGIIFFGTPHGGADPRGLLRTIAENVARVFGFTVNETVLESLLPSSERLKQLRDEFGPMARAEGWKIYCFQEDHGIKALSGRKVVEDASSCLSDSNLEITQHIANDHMDMCRFSGLHDAEYGKVAAAINRILEYTSNRPFSASQTTHSIVERQAYIRSLRFDQIDARHATIKKAHGKTCGWLIKKSEYRDWLTLERLSEHNGLLWIKGNPGTGKSTIMKYILASAKKTMSGATIIAFFFNARGDDLEKTTEGMYRSLLLQLLENCPELEEILDALPWPLLPESGEFEGQWQLETLKNIFQAAVGCIGARGLVCFVDALDECHEDDVRDMVAFFETLAQEAVQSGTQLRVCFSSRHYPHITVDRCIGLVLEDQEGHQDDLAHYLQTELKIGKSQRSEKVKNEILQRANGIFLWVVLVVGILQKEFDRGRIHALQKRLGEIPDGLDKLFKDILTRDGRNRADLMLCLQWILFAKRPLKREELYFAILAGNEPEQLTPWDPNEITTNVMDLFILDCSKGLAELTKTKNQTVQFIHESVRGYLLKEDGLIHLQQPLESNFEGLSHEKLKLCCQNYLKLKDLTPRRLQRQEATEPGVKDDRVSENETQPATPNNDDNPQPPAAAPYTEARSRREDLCADYPFISYAVNHIFDHAEAAAEKKISQTTFTNEFDLATWRQCNNILEKYEIRRHSPSVSLLYIFAEKNLPRLIEIQLQQTPLMDIKGGRHKFPLRAAVAAKNKEAVVEFLKPADRIKGAAQPNLGSTSTQMNDRRLNCAEFLLQNAPTIVKLGEESILFWAFATGRMDLVDTLLATEKVQLTCQIKIKRLWRLDICLGVSATGALHLTSVKPSLYTSRHKRSEWTQVDASDMLRSNVIPWAFEHGYTTLIRHLLWHYMICTPGGSDGITECESHAANPLYSDADLIALISQHTSVDLDMNDDYGQTLLSYAVECELSDLVKYISERTNDCLNKRDNNGWTPLYKAASNGHESIVKLLLEREDIDVNLKNNNGWTPLFIAASNEHESIVKLLLEREDIDVNLKDNGGRTPLLIAASNGHESIVKLLLEREDIDVNLKDNNGWTPLRIAASFGHYSIVRLLLEREDIDVNVKDNGGQTPLWIAARGGEVAIVQLLLERPDIDLGITCLDYNSGKNLTALEVVRAQGKVEVAEALEQKMRLRQVESTL